jgi:hypothetical protein
MMVSLSSEGKREPSLLLWLESTMGKCQSLAGVSLVVGLDVMLGEDDSEVGIAEGGNADQGPGE